MSPFFLAATVFLPGKLSHLPHLAGSRPFRMRVLSPVTAGCLCFLPGQRTPAQSNEPRPIDAVATMLNAFDKDPIVALGDRAGRRSLSFIVRRRRLRRDVRRPSKLMIHDPGIPQVSFRSLFL